MGLYVVFSTCKASPEKIELYRTEHKEFLEILRHYKKLLVAGRFSHSEDRLYIFEAQTLEEARAISERDPHHTAGLFSFEIREWLQEY